jgi:hypothetical protein
MANPEPVPASISGIRRRLISAVPEPPSKAMPAATLDPRADTIDFEAVNGGSLMQEMDQFSHPAAPPEYDDVDMLLQRYQMEKGIPSEPEPQAPPVNTSFPPSARRAGNGDGRMSGFGSMPAELSLSRGRMSASSLPPLTTAAASNGELERLRGENAELKKMVADYRQMIESHELHDWEQKIQEAEQLLGEKDAQNEALNKQIEEWNEKLKSNRFVPSDDELAQTADELDQERAKFSQERKRLEEERKQLKDDEDALMKQMREMEVGMAKDRAELARQRTELQRLHIEIRHELDLLQRGDATLKERMVQFQRRHQDVMNRSNAPPTPMFAAAPAPAAAPPQTAAPEPRPRDSSVFKRLFGQGNG